MTPAQCRLAREKLRWDLRYLEARTGVPGSTIWRFEIGDEHVQPDDIAVVEQVLRVALLQYMREG